MQIINQIFDAVRQGSPIEEIEELISYGAINNHTDDEGKTLLMLAAQMGKYELVKLLFCDDELFIDQKDHFGRTALMFASYKGHLDIVKLLIKEGADLNLESQRGWTALKNGVYSGNLELVKYLVEECSMDINRTSRRGANPFHYAAESNHLDILEYFIHSCDAPINSTDRQGMSALMCAAQNGWDSIISSLMKNGALTSLVSETHRDVVMYAIEENHLHTVKNLIGVHRLDPHYHDEDGWNYLIFAALHGSLEVVKYLVEELELAVDQTSFDGSTPLMYASMAGHMDVVLYLLDEKGADPSIMNKEGKTLMQIVRENDQQELLDRLRCRL